MGVEVRIQETLEVLPLLALKVKEDDGLGVLEKARSRFSLLWEIR